MNNILIPLHWIIKINCTGINNPPMKGLANVVIISEMNPPTIDNDTLFITIDKVYILEDFHEGVNWEYFRAQTIYNIPLNELTTKQELYDVFANAELNMFTCLNKEQKKIKSPLTSNQGHPPNENHQEQVEWIWEHLLKR